MTAASSIRHQVCRHDLVFDFFPESYFEGLLLGNGDLGGMLWFEGDDLVLSLDKTDVWEHRADQNLEPGMDFRTAVRQAREGSFDPHSRLFDPRRPPDRIWGKKLPIGRVVWPLPARPLAFRAELCIYDATFVATVEFESGELQLGGFIHATEPQIRLEITASGDLEMPAAEPRSQCLDEASKKTYRDAWKYPEPEYGSKHGDLFGA